MALLPGKQVLPMALQEVVQGRMWVLGGQFPDLMEVPRHGTQSDPSALSCSVSFTLFNGELFINPYTSRRTLLFYDRAGCGLWVFQTLLV